MRGGSDLFWGVVLLVCGGLFFLSLWGFSFRSQRGLFPPPLFLGRADSLLRALSVHCRHSFVGCHCGVYVLGAKPALASGCTAFGTGPHQGKGGRYSPATMLMTHLSLSLTHSLTCKYTLSPKINCFVDRGWIMGRDVGFKGLDREMYEVLYSL